MIARPHSTLAVFALITIGSTQGQAQDVDADVSRETCGAAAYAAADVDGQAFESHVIAVAPGLSDADAVRQLTSELVAATSRALRVGALWCGHRG